MATMIPNIDPKSIENNGERMFYHAAAELPPEYTVLYSLKYKSQEEDHENEQIKEADFVIVHPSLGYLVVEVKQGEISHRDGTWYELKNNGYVPLNKNPVNQAQNAMFAILRCYKERARSSYFPLKIKYGVAFPECNAILGLLPPDLDEESVFLFDDLENLEAKILSIFDAQEKKREQEAVQFLINRVLAPSFRIFSGLEEQIQMFHSRAERVLTKEQERILEETELDKRKVFFGAAGTGKTLLATEKARRLAASGKKVLLTCFNRNLALHFQNSLRIPGITSCNFHGYLQEVLQREGLEMEGPVTEAEKARYFEETLPECAFDYFMHVPEQEKFDSLVVDEGQDFHETWYMCLESMLKAGGEFYIFADPNQDIFKTGAEFLKKLPLSKQRLTYNLRNTEPINQWITPFVTEGSLRTSLTGGLPVVYLPWRTAAEERMLLEKEAVRLVSQGIKPGRIVILSPHVRAKSSLAGLPKIKEWPLEDLHSENPSAIRFATIRSFKGLEADIVFLIGLKESKACTEPDIYVGGSRARFLLYIFHDKDMKLQK